MHTRMGHVRSYTVVTTTTRRRPVVGRTADIVVGGLLLALALPLIGLIAVAVRLSSHGPIFHREKAFDRRGRPVELLAFRTGLDGSGTTHHERLRAVVGADGSAALTGVGRVLRATRADRLPRLFNVVAGHSGLTRR
jgi:putative colanic acid biosynthesis UDP-glucose lipid carrier transferase